MIAKRMMAFTLSEVLITVGIIGVVSALTIPTLVKNHQRQVYVTQLHKVYNEISDAVERYMTDQRVDDLRESDLGSGKQADLINFINSYFKVVKNCGTRYNDGGSNQCFAASYEAIDGGDISVKNSQCMMVFTLPSGAAICTDIGQMDDVVVGDDTIHSSTDTGTSDNVIGFDVDINGKQGPNIVGRDIFNINVAHDGKVYDKKYVDSGNKMLDNCWISCGQLGKVIDDGWKMNY